MGLHVAEGEAPSGWGLTVYPTAGEAGGRFYSGAESDKCYRPPRSGEEGGRSAVEAARRAKGKVRRYCAANRLNRLGTLTYAGVGCHDPLVIRQDLAEFFRRLRTELGGGPFPYVWVPEWHASGHGLHAHFALGQYVRRRLIEEAWGKGFVHIKLLGDLPVGSGPLEEARRAAGYLSKYVAKAFDERRVPARHRYEVAQGFQPETVRVFGSTLNRAVRHAVAIMGRPPSRSWLSSELQEWHGPPAVYLAWAS